MCLCRHSIRPLQRSTIIPNFTPSLKTIMVLLMAHYLMPSYQRVICHDIRARKDTSPQTFWQLVAFLCFSAIFSVAGKVAQQIVMCLIMPTEQIFRLLLGHTYILSRWCRVSIVQHIVGAIQRNTLSSQGIGLKWSEVCCLFRPCVASITYLSNQQIIKTSSISITHHFATSSSIYLVYANTDSGSSLQPQSTTSTRKQKFHLH